VQGSVYQMLNHGISTGGLFIIVGMLSDRRHTRLIAEFGGLKAVMPRLVAAFLLVTLSSIALPGMNGFIGEFLILLGGFRWHPLMASFAATGVILSAVYMLWMFQRVNYGEITNPKNRALPDLTPREWAMMIPTVALALLMGIFPNIFLKPMEPSIVKTLDRINGTVLTGSTSKPGTSWPDLQVGRPRTGPPGRPETAAPGRPDTRDLQVGRPRTAAPGPSETAAPGRPDTRDLKVAPTGGGGQ